VIERILLSIHLIAGMVWVGSVFMGTFIDWPSARQSVKTGNFPFRFIIGQGRRVFYSVYFGIIVLWISGTALVVVHPPELPFQYSLLIVKAIALFLMTAFTLYGTFFTWPKMQLATHKEAFALYKYYMYRAVGTFSCGILAALCTVWSW